MELLTISITSFIDMCVGLDAQWASWIDLREMHLFNDFINLAYGLQAQYLILYQSY